MCSVLTLFYLFSSRRFDHDFGMMKAGSDQEGFWHTLEKGTT